MLKHKLLSVSFLIQYNTNTCSVMAADHHDESFEAYNLEQEEPGLAVIDTACGKLVHGDVWRTQFLDALSARGFDTIKVEQVTCRNVAS